MRPQWLVRPPSIRATDSLLGGDFTFIIAGKPGSKTLESIRAKLADTPYWLSGRPLDNQNLNGFTAGQLKVMQEVVTLAVFAGFSVLYLGQKITVNHGIGFALIALGATFVFRG